MEESERMEREMLERDILGSHLQGQSDIIGSHLQERDILGSHLQGQNIQGGWGASAASESFGLPSTGSSESLRSSEGLGLRSENLGLRSEGLRPSEGLGIRPEGLLRSESPRRDVEHGGRGLGDTGGAGGRLGLGETGGGGGGGSRMGLGGVWMGGGASAQSLSGFGEEGGDWGGGGGAGGRMSSSRYPGGCWMSWMPRLWVNPKPSTPHPEP